jgi:hypothetical protein
MPEEKKKKKNGFLFSRRSGETIPTADNTREKEDKFNTAYVYYERTNGIPGIPFGSNISLFPLEKISTVSCLFGFCLLLLVVNVSEKETARERERQ